MSDYHGFERVLEKYAKENDDAMRLAISAMTLYSWMLDNECETLSADSDRIMKSDGLGNATSACVPSAAFAIQAWLRKEKLFRQPLDVSMEELDKLVIKQVPQWNQLVFPLRMQLNKAQRAIRKLKADFQKTIDENMRLIEESKRLKGNGLHQSQGNQGVNEKILGNDASGHENGSGAGEVPNSSIPGDENNSVDHCSLLPRPWGPEILDLKEVVRKLEVDQWKSSEETQRLSGETQRLSGENRSLFLEVVRLRKENFLIRHPQTTNDEIEKSKNVGKKQNSSEERANNPNHRLLEATTSITEYATLDLLDFCAVHLGLILVVFFGCMLSLPLLLDGLRQLGRVFERREAIIAASLEGFGRTLRALDVLLDVGLAYLGMLFRRLLAGEYWGVGWGLGVCALGALAGCIHGYLMVSLGTWQVLW